MEVPDSLARRIELWKLHGRVFREGYDTIADSLDEGRVAQAMAQMREDYRKAAEALPDQEEFLRRAGAWAGAEVTA
jgi:tryptophan halogenase